MSCEAEDRFCRLTYKNKTQLCGATLVKVVVPMKQKTEQHLLRIYRMKTEIADMLSVTLGL